MSVLLEIVLGLSQAQFKHQRKYLGFKGRRILRCRPQNFAEFKNFHLSFLFLRTFL